MNNKMLFDISSYESVPRINWDEKIISVTKNEVQIIKWIMQLHNGGEAFDVDPCYSVGRFWNGLPKPKYRYDLRPVIEGVEQANSSNLPLADASVSSIMFDPPFIFNSSQKSPGKIRSRFSDFRSFDELKKMYLDSLKEFWRILKLGGIVAFKCQDMFVSQDKYFVSAFVINAAQSVGFYILDNFVLVNTNLMMSSTWKNGQKHSRTAHSFFYVLKKQNNPNRLKRTRVQV